MSEQEARVFAAIKAFIQQNGYPPVMRELCDALNYSYTSRIHQSLVNLRMSGYVDWTRHKTRTLRILKDIEESSC